MSLDPQYNQNHSQKTLDKLKNLEQLEQVAAAAGHGYSQIGLDLNAGWTELTIAEDNVRPSYDLRYIRTFSPSLLRAMLFELSELRKAVAEKE